MSIIRKGPSWPLAVAFLALALFFYAERTARTQFGPNSYAGPSAGSANAQTITIQNISALTDILYQPITFTVGLNNTGATTVNANAFGVRNVLRAIPGQGLVALGGGELVVGQLATVMWDGTEFQLLTSANPILPGFIGDYGGTSCPAGFFSANSQTPSQAAYPALFAVLGTNWGSPGGGNFTVPDLRGRTTYGLDANVGGFADRITAAGGNFDNRTLATAGNRQNYTLGLNDIPSFNPASTITPFTVSGQVNTGSLASGTLSGNMPTGNLGVKIVSGSTFALAGGVSFGAGDGGPLQLADTRIFNFTSNSTGVSGSSIGGGLAHPTLSSGATTNKCIRA